MYIEFLDGKKHPAKNADISDDHTHFADAGYLLTENDLIVDIDNLPKDVIEKMISLFNIKTQIVWSERGCHLYFKMPRGFRGTRKVIPLGFEVEYKHFKNTKHITIKRNGVMREIENEGVREDLPACLYSKKRLDSLLGLSDGEGRNQALFKHRMKIADVKEWASILRFINNHIIADPLEEKEFQLIVRDIKIEAEKDGEPAVADFLLTKYKIVKYAGKLYFYENGEYINDMEKLHRLVFSEVGSQKTRYVDEVIRQLDYRSPLIDQKQEFDIKLQNGILRDGRFIEVDYHDFTPYNIKIPYYPDAEPVKAVDDYINHLTDNDPDYRKLLLEILAHGLITNKEFKRMVGKFFIFVGDGGNGKGTLLFLIRQIYGDHNCAGLSIKEIANEKYFTTLEHKLLNLGDDIQDQPINDKEIKMLKNISTCDYVAMRDLYKQSRDVELTTTLIFTSNHVLKTFEKGNSVKRRILWCQMFGKPVNKSKKFISTITSEDALIYWMKLIVEGYLRLYRNEDYTVSKVVEQYNDKYHEENNSVLQYLADYTADHFIDRRSPECHEEYEIFAIENGLNVQSRKLFVQSIYDVFGLSLGVKKVHGKARRVFMPDPKSGKH